MSIQKIMCLCTFPLVHSAPTHTRPTLLNVYEFVKWLRFDVIASLQFSYGRKYPFSFATTKKQNRRTHTHTHFRMALCTTIIPFSNLFSSSFLQRIHRCVCFCFSPITTFTIHMQKSTTSSSSSWSVGTWHWRAQSTVDMMFWVHPLSTIYYCFSCLSRFFRVEWIAHAVNVVVCCTSLRLVSAV